MNRTLTLLLGIAAGAAFTAVVASTKRGKEVRNNLIKKADELRDALADNIEKKARNIHDSEVIYS